MYISEDWGKIKYITLQVCSQLMLQLLCSIYAGLQHSVFKRCELLLHFVLGQATGQRKMGDLKKKKILCTIHFKIVLTLISL